MRRRSIRILRATSSITASTNSTSSRGPSSNASNRLPGPFGYTTANPSRTAMASNPVSFAMSFPLSVKRCNATTSGAGSGIRAGRKSSYDRTEPVLPNSVWVKPTGREAQPVTARNRSKIRYTRRSLPLPRAPFPPSSETLRQP